MKKVKWKKIYLCDQITNQFKRSLTQLQFAINQIIFLCSDFETESFSDSFGGCWFTAHFHGDPI